MGSIYHSAKPENPGTYIGGTWVRIAEGRVLVGLDASDSDFDTSEKTGGSKSIDLRHSHSMQSHTHTLSHTHTHSHTHAQMTQFTHAYTNSNGFTYTEGGTIIPDGQISTRGASTSTTSDASTTTTSGPSKTNTDNGLSSSQSIIQPYYTCYIWKRTA